MSSRIDSTRYTLHNIGAIMQTEPTVEVAISSIVPILGEIAVSLAILADAKGYVYVDDEVDAVKVVRCKDCKHSGTKMDEVTE